MSCTVGTWPLNSQQDNEIVRLMFAGNYRSHNLLLNLNYDSCLKPSPDKTYVFVGPRVPFFDLTETIHNLCTDRDWNSISVVLDQDLLNHYELQEKNIDIYKFGGGWIAQQLIKLLAIDYIDAEYILVQDCDTTLVNLEYEYFKNGKPVLLELPQESHNPEYYEYIQTFLGISRADTSCYVTEFMPITKTHWNNLKSRIEEQHNKWWLQAIYDQFSNDYIEGKQLWFSEYELLANWMLHCDPNIEKITQKRLEVFNQSLYNSICF